VLNFAAELLKALSDGDVEFVVVGGVSAVLNGAPIVTQDLDVCYRREETNLERLAAALKPFDPRLRGLPPGLPDRFDIHSLRLGANFTLTANNHALDLLATMSGIGSYEDIIQSTESRQVFGIRVRVLSLTDLIRSKKAAGRPKDLAVIPVLEATLQIIREQAAGYRVG
jgi:predicted nucleotidyltransferase